MLLGAVPSLGQGRGSGGKAPGSRETCPLELRIGVHRRHIPVFSRRLAIPSRDLPSESGVLIIRRQMALLFIDTYTPGAVGRRGEG